MTSLLSDVRKRFELEKVRASIPKERYEFNANSSPTERHLKRAEEVKDESPDLYQYYLNAAEECKALEVKQNADMANLLEDSNQAIAELRDEEFQKALQMGQPIWQSALQYLLPAVSKIYSHSYLIWMLALVYVGFQFFGRSVHQGLWLNLTLSIFGFIALAATGITSLVLSFGAEQKPARLIRLLGTIAIASVCGFWIWVISNFGLISPLQGNYGFQIRDGEVVQFVDTRQQFFVHTDVVDAESMIWFQVNRPEFVLSSEPIRSLNGLVQIHGKVKMSFQEVLKTDDLSIFANLSMDPKQYRKDLTEKASAVVAKYSKGPENTDYGLIKKEIDGLSNEVYFLTDTKIVFDPDADMQPDVILAH